MGWPVTELYRDVKSPWARQRNPIWRPLLGGDNSAPAGAAAAAVRPAMRSRHNHRALLLCPICALRGGLLVRGEYTFPTGPRPPQPPFMSTESSVFYVFIKRVNRGFLQDKRETTSVTEICVHHNHSFRGFSINYKQHLNL